MDLLAAVAAWAERRPDVRAVLLVGSRARTAMPADRWSDHDLVLIVDDPAPYLDDAEWVGELGRSGPGEPVLTFLEPTATGGLTERRVLFAGGVDADFSIAPVAAMDVATLPPDVRGVLARGCRVLVDKIGLSERIAALPPPEPDGPPTQQALDQLSNDFWYHVLWTAKKARRGELWIATMGCDSYLKALLVQLAGWHARALDPTVDTWHRGRFLERWADPALLAALPSTYAGYSAPNVARALRTTATEFERLERDLAGRLGLALPVDHAGVRARLASIVDSTT
jgi:aminoglycoside 6-adenylyltransferase